MQKLANISLFESLGADANPNLAVFNRSENTGKFAQYIVSLKHEILGGSDVGNSVIRRIRKYYEDLCDTAGVSAAREEMNDLANEIRSIDKKDGSGLLAWISKMFKKPTGDFGGDVVGKATKDAKQAPTVHAKPVPPGELNKLIEGNRRIRKRY